MQTYSVKVLNELTGEMRVVEVPTSYYTDAQIEALFTVFNQEGWSKTRALQLEDVSEAS